MDTSSISPLRLKIIMNAFIIYILLIHADNKHVKGEVRYENIGDN